MADYEYGPVELILAAFDGDTPSPEVIDAVLSLDDAGTIRVLDLLEVSRSTDGELTILEIDAFAPDPDAIDLPESGLASEEDVAELAAALEPGTSALLLVAEHRWATHLASRLAEANGTVVESVRIPAPIVNEVVAAAAAVE
ncbi:DUF6325 family protein [Microbacter sp. GSS18]|nr:DUF6325 family protein [Microbacter sp. GSS18]